MAALVSFRSVSLAFGVAPVFDSIDLHIEAGQRICLLGRNGAGKSTLLSLVAGEMMPDSGVVDRKPDLRIATLQQEVPADVAGTVFDVVARSARAELSEVAQRQQVEATLSRVNLDGSAEFAPLSAGNKRRVMLACALTSEPDLLLLDEPTNHLDIEAIDWLERFLLRFDGTVLFVTHDRAFLQAIATRVVELECGRVHSFAGDYGTFLRRRDELLAEEERQNAVFDKKLAQEEAWLRQGIKARRTRNEGRKRALMALRDQRKARRDRVGNVRINLQEAERSGKLVAKAKELSVGYGDRLIVKDFSTIVLRGDRVGAVGPNGCGKTTLVRALLGALEPRSGTTRLGANVQVAYFDQLREQLDESKTVRDNVAEGAESVQIDGRPRHVMTYLSDWLFSSERANSPLASLSGGERNRLLLARLFLKPSNLLVLDEPTNDLDVETLELLEQRLVEYNGTVILVSHDRAFLDNVATSTLAYEGPGRFVEYAGGYSDLLVQRRGIQAEDERPAEVTRVKTKGVKPKTDTPRKLTFKEKHELEELPGRIETLESEQAALHEAMSSPSFYQQTGDAMTQAKTRLEALEGELELAYERWQQLDSIPS